MTKKKKKKNNQPTYFVGDFIFKSVRTNLHEY